MMKLYALPITPSSIKVSAVLEHLKMPCTYETIDLTKMEQKTPEFLKINPNGRVPVLEDNGFLLSESEAIMQYLAAKKPDAKLWPSDPKKQATISRWQHWQSMHFGHDCHEIIFEKFAKANVPGLGNPDPKIIQRAQEALATLLPILDQALKESTYIAGEELTIADFSLASWFVFQSLYEISLTPYKNISRWYKKISELPAWKKAVPQELQAQGAMA